MRVLMCAVLVAGSVQAAPVYKCESGGQVSYQDTPCAAGDQSVFIDEQTVQSRTPGYPPARQVTWSFDVKRDEMSGENSTSVSLRADEPYSWNGYGYHGSLFMGCSSGKVGYAGIYWGRTQEIGRPNITEVKFDAEETDIQLWHTTNPSSESSFMDYGDVSGFIDRLGSSSVLRVRTTLLGGSLALQRFTLPEGTGQAMEILQLLCEAKDPERILREAMASMGG